MFHPLTWWRARRWPCPSVLTMGLIGAFAYHTVIAICTDHIRVITGYIPEEDKWIEYCTRKSAPWFRIIAVYAKENPTKEQRSSWRMLPRRSLLSGMSRPMFAISAEKPINTAVISRKIDAVMRDAHQKNVYSTASCRWSFTQGIISFLVFAHTQISQ